MNPAARITLALVALVLLALAAWQLLGLGAGDERPSPVTDGSSPAATSTDADPIAAPRSSDPTAEATRVDPVEGARKAVEAQPTPDTTAQGVRGRVVASNGAPIEGAQVFLMGDPGGDLLTMLQLAHKGRILPPEAITTSAADGSFAFGVRKPVPGRTYELRVHHSKHADASMPNVRVEPAVWYDLGDIPMSQGLVAHGQITVSGTNGAGVPGATVFALRIQGLAGLNPTPGREKGIATTADENGNYRFENLSHALYTLSAVASGYAKGERANCPIRPAEDNRYDFALDVGKSIAGRVTDTAGQPIRGAVVKAVSMSPKSVVAEDTTSDSTGAFELLGLIDGPYQLTAVAMSYVESAATPVIAGQQDVQLVLERQCSARLRVSATSGRLLRNYQVTIQRYFEGQEQFGNVGTSPMQLVHPRDLDSEGVVEIGGLDPGAYVFEVLADDFAKTYSGPFLVDIGAPAPLVELTMKVGGALQGVVVSVDGSPIADVEVKTIENHLDDHTLSVLFSRMIPSKITRATVRTDAAGKYTLRGLAEGPYQLRFEHRDLAPLTIKDLTVVDGSTTEVPPQRMLAGTLISGTTYVDGVPSALVKVTIESTATRDESSPPPFAVEAISGSGGLFEMPRRIPAGSYTVRAARQNLASPLMQVVDVAKTQRDFDVAPGQTSLTLNFSIQSEGK